MFTLLMILPATLIHDIVSKSLDEDAGLGDATTAALFPRPIRARGVIMAHQAMTVAGIAVAREVFAQVDPDIRVVRAVEDGLAVGPNAVVMTVEGDGRSLLIAERVALNF